MLAALFLDIKYVINTSPAYRTVELSIAILLGFASYPIATKALNKMKKIEDELTKESRCAKLGSDGENSIGEWLSELLPKKSYKILRNVNLPGHKFDIDFVVIGPKGIFVFEVKNFSDQITFSDDEYFKIIDGKKRVLPIDQDPRTEIKKHAYALRKHFENRELYNLIISKAVVFGKKNAAILNGKPGVYIINGRESLINYINRANELPEYTKEYCQTIIKCLETK